MVLHPRYTNYDVIEDGEVWSMPRVVVRSNGRPHTVARKALKPQPHTNGHLQVAVYQDGVCVRKFVHHMVLETFVGPCPEGLKGLHRDDDPTNNRVDNLYWGTTSQNALDSVRNGTHHHAKKVECKRGHELVAPNLGKSKGRACLACNRANTLANYRGISDEGYRQRLSDEKFAVIMKAEG